MVYLCLVDLLGVVVQVSCIFKVNGVGCGKQMEIWVWCDDFVLVQQGQFVVCFKYMLDYEYNVCVVCIVFVKYDGGWVVQGLWQDVFVEFGDLFVIVQFDCVFIDQVDL